MFILSTHSLWLISCMLILHSSSMNTDTLQKIFPDRELPGGLDHAVSSSVNT